MTNNVVNLKGETVRPIQEELIPVLETIIEHVRSGRVVGLAIIEALADGCVANEWNTNGHAGQIALGAQRLLHSLVTE